MNTESEVFQQAVTLVKDHGEDAPICAATRAQTLLDQGDPVGHALWKRIGKKRAPSCYRRPPCWMVPAPRSSPSVAARGVQGRGP